MISDLLERATLDARRVLAVAIALAIAACGGGGNSDGPSAAPKSGATVKGFAIRDKAVPGAIAKLRDADGQEASVVSSADGSFELTAKSITYPALLRIDVPGSASTEVGTLYAVLESATAGNVWVSPLTTSTVAALSRGETPVLFASLGKSTSARDALTAARIAQAENAIKKQLPVFTSPATVNTLFSATDRLVNLPLTLTDPGISNLLKKLTATVSVNALAQLIGTELATVKIGCDDAALRLLSDGSQRPACLEGSNFPVSRSVAAGFKPVAAEHPADPGTWAEMLAGVPRGPHWKAYTPGGSSAALQPPLRAKLKSLASDLWSGKTDVSFPETYGIDTGPVQALVDNIIDVQWETLGKKLKVSEVSNTTFEFQVLRLLLSSDSTRSKLFNAVPVDSVRLAAPTFGIDAQVNLEPMGQDIKSFAKAWLSAPENRSTGLSVTTLAELDASRKAIEDHFLEILCEAGIDRICAVSNMEILITPFVAKTAALPSQQSTLISASTALANWWRQFADSCQQHDGSYLPDYLSPADKAKCDALSTKQASVFGTYFAAYNSAVTQAQSTSPETAGAFYTRFLAALANHITDEYENHFERQFTKITSESTPSFTPVVLSVELYDDVAYSACCLTAAEINAPRSALVYYAAGSAVKFSSYPDGTANTNTVPPVPIELASFSASPLSGISTRKVWGPIEVPVTQTLSAFAIAIACTNADAACMARLARSNIGGNRSTLSDGMAGYSAGFSALTNAIAASGGITEVTYFIDVRPGIAP